MKKEIICDKCNGAGEIEVIVCDECGEYPAGKYEDKDLCHNCWAKTLSKKDINNL